jgi:hypothetical protein
MTDLLEWQSPRNRQGKFIVPDLGFGIHQRAKGPSNNGMKLTARGASVEARQLIPVFYGQA